MYALFLAGQRCALMLQPDQAEKSRILRRKFEEYKAASMIVKTVYKLLANCVFDKTAVFLMVNTLFCPIRLFF
ncbi:hypothetical protein NB640_12680 [Oxalobacter vibrioformis]|uniref:Uncharacterized protein n=1 Tax=Oxalobacter vibrioformis TaxID=933080 RepID=A0A9E9LWN0_9BURK|nr:hypothetical protein [Oxalobacter vibrioformis]WAW10052.1 hypothetical protein NB640_12680 [Oxalobacter vibrioformis]